MKPKQLRVLEGFVHEEREVVLPPDFEIQTAAVVDGLIDESYGVSLRDQGFAPERRRYWVRQRLPFGFDVFQLQAIGQSALSPRWGFSLAYVPEIRGGRLRWHRTARTPVFDIVVDPLDLILPEHATFMLYKSRKRDSLHATLHEQAPRLVQQAQQTWASVDDLEALARLLRELQARKTVRFAFHNYVQQPLAYAFTLARLGRLDEARTELQKSRYMNEPELAQQLNEALNHAGSAE